MSTEQRKLRVFFIPSFDLSHAIPITDIACAFARRPEVEPTIVVTPASAESIRATLDQSAARGHQINILTYPFPSVGLPPGVETVSSAPPSEAWRVHKAIHMSRPIHEEILRSHHPDAIIADIPHWWITDVAKELGIPSLTFHVGAFNQLVIYKLIAAASKDRSSPTVSKSQEVITVPDLPGPPIMFPWSELPEFLQVPNETKVNTWDWDMEKIRDAQRHNFGTLLNTFYELEPGYCDLYRKTHAKRAYCVGPVDLLSISFSSDGSLHRGGAASAEANQCLRWLDMQKEASVLYISFGTICTLCADEATQLRELAIGLEKSSKPFIWKVKSMAPDSVSWMPEGWEERVKNRGLITRGWVPQAAILAHKSTGAFMTHCGWNSVLEAISGGTPMLTWPLVMDQFANDRLVVDILEIGARVSEGPRSSIEANRKIISANEIEKAISGLFINPKFMDNAKKYSILARSAVEEGGSSHCDLERLIGDLRHVRDCKEKFVSKLF